MATVLASMLQHRRFVKLADRTQRVMSVVNCINVQSRLPEPDVVHEMNVSNEDARQKGKLRLDTFISQQLAESSRARVQGSIKAGLVTINGKPARKPAATVKPGDRIICTIPPLPPLQASPEDLPLHVVHEDAHVLVLNKPAGMVVHPSPGHYSGTLVNALLHHCGLGPMTVASGSAAPLALEGEDEGEEDADEDEVIGTQLWVDDGKELSNGYKGAEGGVGQEQGVESVELRTGSPSAGMQGERLLPGANREEGSSGQAQAERNGTNGGSSSSSPQDRRDVDGAFGSTYVGGRSINSITEAVGTASTSGTTSSTAARVASDSTRTANTSSSTPSTAARSASSNTSDTGATASHSSTPPASDIGATASHSSTQPAIIRPGIVHRLDRGTSGLMVVAKTERSHHHLCDQFKERTVDRLYVSIALGCPREREGQVLTNVVRDPGDRKRMAACAYGSGRGRTAASNYKVLEVLAGGAASLVQWKLQTGRTHQIRVHARHIGHPLFGDATYGGGTGPATSIVAKNKPSRQQEVRKVIVDFDRPALHALTLGFEHPGSGERLFFESQLPPDFTEVLSWLRDWQ